MSRFHELRTHLGQYSQHSQKKQLGRERRDRYFVDQSHRKKGRRPNGCSSVHHTKQRGRRKHPNPYIGMRKVFVRRLYAEPRRCLRCQNFADHMAASCPGPSTDVLNALANTGPTHAVSRIHRCTNALIVKKTGHQTSDRKCEAYKEQAERIRGNNPDQYYKYFPVTHDQSSWEYREEVSREEIEEFETGHQQGEATATTRETRNRGTRNQAAETGRRPPTSITVTRHSLIPRPPNNSNRVQAEEPRAHSPTRLTQSRIDNCWPSSPPIDA